MPIVLDLFRTAANAWIDDNAPRMSAALAYYTLFSIAPLLLIVVSVAGLVFGDAAARGQIVDQISGVLGQANARTIEALLRDLNRPGQGALGTLIGSAVLLVGATTVFAELQDSMDRIWRAPPLQTSGLLHVLQVRLLSVGMLLGIGFLLIVSLVFSAALAALGKWGSPWLGPQVTALASVLDVVLTYVFMTALFAGIYKWMPRVRVAWRDVWLGAAITAVLFTIGKWLIGLFIGRSGVESTFGAAASLAVLMAWVYYSALIFLFGAEFSSAFAHRCGSLRDRKAPPRGPA